MNQGNTLFSSKEPVNFTRVWNIGGLWSDEPELTGRVLHEAQREVVLYLALLEPSLEEFIRTAMALQNQSAVP